VDKATRSTIPLLAFSRNETRVGQLLTTRGSSRDESRAVFEFRAPWACFRDEWPRGGFIHAIGELGARLVRDFPCRPGDDHELTDEVSLG
jgi:hypothetical protein